MGSDGVVEKSLSPDPASLGTAAGLDFRLHVFMFLMFGRWLDPGPGLSTHANSSFWAQAELWKHHYSPGLASLGTIAGLHFGPHVLIFLRFGLRLDPSPGLS